MKINDSVGHCVAQIRLIFWINHNSQKSGLFLAYFQHFDVILQPSGSTGQVPDLASGFYALKRAMQAGNLRLGDVVPLTQLQAAAQISPRFGSKADPRLTSQTCIEYSSEFWLNKYETKEMFWALHT